MWLTILKIVKNLVPVFSTFWCMIWFFFLGNMKRFWIQLCWDAHPNKHTGVTSLMTVSMRDIFIWHFQYPFAANAANPPWLNGFMKFPGQREKLTEQSSEFLNGFNICPTCFAASAGSFFFLCLSHAPEHTLTHTLNISDPFCVYEGIIWVSDPSYVIFGFII